MMTQTEKASQKQTEERNELKKYYNFNLSMLQLMAVLAILGIIVTVVLHAFLG